MIDESQSLRTHMNGANFDHYKKKQLLRRFLSKQRQWNS